MSTINLTDAEVLSFSQAANLLDGANYQYGRTISLSITAFIKPPNGSEVSRFTYITNKEKERLEELQASGFVDNISINGEIIQNVKILSFDFPTTEASITDHIQLLRVNMELEYYEAIDNTENLTASDPELYKSVDFLGEAYARYFESFSENYDFSVSESNEFSFSQAVTFSLRKDSPTDIDFTSIVKEITIKAFNNTGNAIAKVGFIDDRYANFIRTVKANGLFSESHDAINNSYSITRSVNLKNGAYRSDQKDELWSADFAHSVAVEPSGSVTITESGSVMGRSNVDLESGISNKGEDAYENAFQGYKVVKAKAYARCQKILEDLIKSKPDWIPGSSEWSSAGDLKNRYMSLGLGVNRQTGMVTYNISFTNNPRMHNDAIFQYSIEGSRYDQNITSITESGTITPYDKNRVGDFDPKSLYDLFTSSSDVIDRMDPLFDSLKLSSSITKFSFPTNLISSSISFNAHGISVNYSFTYSDDPGLRNETYIRRLESRENYTLPVANRSSVIAPNIKETNYDANQTSEGTKDIGFNCVFKRNPSSNIINSDHINYIKTASSNILTSLKGEAQKMAYVSSDQVGKDELSWYPTQMSYSTSFDYNFDFSLAMNFIDKKGVMPEALKY